LRPLRLLVLALLSAGCAAAPAPSGSSASPAANPSGAGSPPSADARLRYVALGDSYTIGTGVSLEERWPNQLVEALRGRVELELVANLGVNGYTSANVIDRELPALAQHAPDFVSLLIGVNDVVRGVPLDGYRANIVHILDALLESLPPERIVVVSVPDYTRTPSGSDFGDPAQQRAAIANFNAIMAGAAAERKIAFVDIGPVADLADRDASLVAGDGLHPSGAQYARWVELVAPVAAGLLGAP
jgi:lysophospholipase L1-like esterase